MDSPESTEEERKEELAELMSALLKELNKQNRKRSNRLNINGESNYCKSCSKEMPSSCPKCGLEMKELNLIQEEHIVNSNTEDDSYSQIGQDFLVDNVDRMVCELLNKLHIVDDGEDVPDERVRDSPIIDASSSGNKNTSPDEETLDSTKNNTKFSPQKISIIDLPEKILPRLKGRYKPTSVKSLLFDNSIGTCYTELDIYESNLAGVRKSDHLIKLKGLFSMEAKEILLTGDAGFGKTTLLRKVAYDWATDDYYMCKFDAVLIICLREMKGIDIWTEITKGIFEEEYEDKIEALKISKLSLLIMLDGLDGISDKSPVTTFIKERPNNMTVLLTSRPDAAGDIKCKFGLRLSTFGFSKENQKEYVIKAKQMYEIRNINILIEKIEKENLFCDLAKSPLILDIFCRIHKNLDLCSIENLGHLYTEVFRLFSVCYLYECDRNNLCTLLTDEYLLKETLFIRLGQLTWKSLNDDNYLITSEILRGIFPDEDDYNFISRSGILVAITDDVIKYAPLHRTFVEFLSARYISSLKPSLVLKFSRNHLLIDRYKVTFTYDVTKESNFLFHSVNIFVFICGLMSCTEYIVQSLADIIEGWNSVGYFREMYNYLNALREDYYEMWKRCCFKVKTFNFKFADFSANNPEIYLQHSLADKIVITETEDIENFYNVREDLRNLLLKNSSVRQVVFRLNPCRRFYKIESSNCLTYLFDIRFVMDLIVKFYAEPFRAINFELCVRGFSKSADHRDIKETTVGLLSRSGSEICFGNDLEFVSQNDAGSLIFQYEDLPDIPAPNKLIYIVSYDQYKILSNIFTLDKSIKVLENVIIKWNGTKIIATYTSYD